MWPLLGVSLSFTFRSLLFTMSAQSNLVAPALFSDSRSSSTTDVSSIQDVKDEKAQVDVESRSVRNDGADSEKEEMEDSTLVGAFTR